MPEPKKDQPEKKTTLIARQKSFEFNRCSPDVRDKTVNDWLKKQALEGHPAQLGKTFSDSGVVHIIYMYTERIEI